MPQAKSKAGKRLRLLVSCVQKRLRQLVSCGAKSEAEKRLRLLVSCVQKRLVSDDAFVEVQDPYAVWHGCCIYRAYNSSSVLALRSWFWYAATLLAYAPRMMLQKEEGSGDYLASSPTRRPSATSEDHCQTFW